MAKRPRRHLRCKYCGYEWFGWGKRCPNCNNPRDRKPRMYRYRMD